MTRESRSAEAMVVDRQMDAYNRQALDEFLDCYDDAVELFADGAAFASGRAALREVYGPQFASARVRATSLARIEQAQWVADHERVEAEGAAALTVLALYRVREGRIDQVHFLGQGASA
ncbi:nuclear transport factor 2 family protein [Streptomyces sp. NPDC097595]|uniref:nuclear transport factor 2 family protein n=1 Tax=Streptomyces sp. NPDC097595 TaxID=3366090 RepID=UPI00381D916C